MKREISGGEVHSYEIPLATGQFAHVIVFQRGIDLAVTLVGPDGEKLPEIDSPNGSWGPEEVSIVAAGSGSYRLEVRPLEQSAAGPYEVKIDELRIAGPKELSRVAAQRAYAEGEKFRSEETAESYRRAIDKYEKAYSLRREADDRHGEGIALVALGEVYFLLGERQKALEYYNNALPIWRTFGDDAELAEVFNHMAVVYYGIGESQKALDYHTRALVLRRGVSDRPGESYTLNNIGEVYSSLGEYGKALDYFDRALQLRRELGSRYAEAITLTNMGVAYHAMNDDLKALEYLNQALPLRRGVADRRGEATTLTRIGTVYDSLGEKEKALDYFHQALSLGRTTGDRYGEAETLDQIGAVYASFGEKQRALDHYQLALGILHSVGDRVGEAQALYNIARVERDRGNLIESRKQIEAALAIIDALRAKVGSQQLRASYFGSVKRSYELYIDLLIRLHRREPSEGFNGLALTASEMARSRSLAELLTEARVDIRQGVDRALLDRERALRELVNAKAEAQIRFLSGKHTEQQAAAVAKEIESLKTEYEQVNAQIRLTSPRYAALAQPEPLTLSDIQKQVVDGDPVLLEYALGEERSYLFVVTSTSMKVHELAKRAEIETATRRVYDLLSARSRQVKFESGEDRRARIARADAEYPKAAAALSQTLLGSLAGELGSKRLLIVAEGALQYLPFAALPSPSNPVVALGAEHEVVSLPSASVLAVLRREIAGRAPPPRTLAVLADPVFEKDDERLKGAGGVASGQNAKSVPSSDSPLVRSAQEMGLEESGQLRIPRLPFTRREAESIFSLAPPTKRKEVLDFEANRAAATSEELGQYRFVHFATHGFLNSFHPELSGLVFSLFDREGKDQDGFLSALEVYNLKLPVDLVVLSGCRTGLGKDVKGEGLVGLTRGFMYAGAARVLVSLWDVDDEATAALMTRFYEGMLGTRHLSAAAALRAAQISIAKEGRWRSPYYWAAFILQGEPN
jgi:CHAT domain-containing protein/Tfp pilus assembly protein PilF